MEKFVIAISRSYGSGGHLVGRKLAVALGIPYYDKAIIEMTAEKSGLSQDYIEQLENHASNSFLFNLATNYSFSGLPVTTQYDMPIGYTAFAAQVAVIRELAERSSCVIVGRCSGYVLREKEYCTKIFIYSDRKDRVARIAKLNDISEKEAESKLNKIDRSRSNYYKNFTGENFGASQNHDLCINTSRTGIDGAVEVIKTFLRSSNVIE